MGLPSDKIEKLVERTKDKIYEATKREYKDLRSHEVPAKDAFSIVKRAADRSLDKVYGSEKELEQ